MFSHGWHGMRPPRPAAREYRELIIVSGGRSSCLFHVLGLFVFAQVNMIMRSLGLTNAKDTIVGNNSLRGVSGGERRRVTLGEMICGPQTVFLLDSVSTGLDSSTTFDIMNTLKVCMYVCIYVQSQLGFYFVSCFLF